MAGGNFYNFRNTSSPFNQLAIFVAFKQQVRNHSNLQNKKTSQLLALIDENNINFHPMPKEILKQSMR